MTDSIPTTPFCPEDYEAIEAAVMETARGRWFLAEYARRHRAADTEMLLAAIRKLEASLHPDATPDADTDPVKPKAADGEPSSSADLAQPAALPAPDKSPDTVELDAFEAEALESEAGVVTDDFLVIEDDLLFVGDDDQASPDDQPEAPGEEDLSLLVSPDLALEEADVFDINAELPVEAPVETVNPDPEADFEGADVFDLSVVEAASQGVEETAMADEFDETEPHAAPASDPTAGLSAGERMALFH
ncbi:MAG: hypothetical protein AAGF59_07780 [Pseudomonadota bacterium]